MRERAWAWFSLHAQGKHALFWLCFLSYIEPFLSPIVPEALMTAMIIVKKERWRFYALLTTLFTFLGGITGYFLGVFLFNEFATPLLQLSGYQQYHDVSQTILGGNIFLIMFFIAFTLLPDKPFTYLSGFLGVPFFAYASGLLLGRSMRVVLVAYLSYRFGPQILEVVNRYFFWFALAVLALLALYGIVQMRILPL
ncbi:MAG: DedA family protein [Parcubacteria group bacterium Gr01-1014_56]|nr:MAG: DedA family protein [Parcubacteria group bacterium Gr01-1014_56]